MKILIACEFSGIVREAFKKKGHDVMSCDLLPTEQRGNHYLGDVFEIINGWPVCEQCGELMSAEGDCFLCHYCEKMWPNRYVINYMEQKNFDMMIAFPPCTYLCNGGANWLNRKPEWRGKRENAVDFFMSLVNVNIKKVAIENPIGHMSTRYRKPDQIIRPFMFGHEYSKDVCLWLKNLPKLQSTNHCPGPYKKLDFWSTKRNQGGKSLKSITFQGIADAMADQWG